MSDQYYIQIAENIDKGFMTAPKKVFSFHHASRKLDERLNTNIMGYLFSNYFNFKESFK